MHLPAVVILESCGALGVFGNMKSKRERDDDNERGNENGVFDSDSKRQRVDSRPSPSSSPPPPASENTLLPGFNYGDEDEEKDNQRAPPVIGNRERQNGALEEEDEDEDDYPLGQGVGQGRRSREIEIRRDCPYLDTVNRQVILLVSAVKYRMLACL